jgi:hypothetical protein
MNSINHVLHEMQIKFEPSREMIDILRQIESLELDGKQDVSNKLNRLRNRIEGNPLFGSMNLIPSEFKGSCRAFCLAIASKKFDKPRKGLESGFKGIILHLFAYWFGCLSINKETLILTSNWDNEGFEQYKPAIDNYVKTHNKIVCIIEVGPTGYFLRYPF